MKQTNRLTVGEESALTLWASLFLISTLIGFEEHCPDWLAIALVAIFGLATVAIVFSGTLEIIITKLKRQYYAEHHEKQYRHD